MSDQEIQSVPSSEPSSDDVIITISPDSPNSMSELEGMYTPWILGQPLAAASPRRLTDNLDYLLSRYESNSIQYNFLSEFIRMHSQEGTLRQAAASSSELEGMYTPWFLGQPLAAASPRRLTDNLDYLLSRYESNSIQYNFLSEFIRMHSQEGTLRQAAASSSELEGMYTPWFLGQPLAAASPRRMTDNLLSLFCSRLSEFNNVLYNYVSEHVRMNSQEGTLRQAAASSRSLADNIAVIGLIGAIAAWLYGILFQLADKMDGSFFSHHRGMVMISGASMVYAAFSGVFLCVIFFLAAADPTSMYRKRMRFLWGTYFYAACCGPAVMLMAMIVPSFGYKVLAWAVLGALFTPVGLYIGGYY